MIAVADYDSCVSHTLKINAICVSGSGRWVVSGPSVIGRINLIRGAAVRLPTTI